MTDKELIQAFRECQRHPQCDGCELGDKPDDCYVIESLAPCEAINRLEALLAENAEMNIQIQKEICKRVEVEAENEHLREVTKMVPKWVSVKERLPEMRQSEYDDIDGTHSRYQSEPVLGVGRAGDVAIVWLNRTDWGESYWEDEPGNCYEITHWMPLPSTEGAE